MVILASVLLMGCGEDTSPSGALLSVVNEKKMTSQEDVSKTISDYYKRAKSNIVKDNCSELSTSSENILDKSIVEVSKKHCGHTDSFKQEMNSALTKINTDKSMSISMKDIDGTQDFIDAGFDKEATKVFLSANIALKDAVDMVNANILYEKDILKFVALGVTSFDEMKIWTSVKGHYFRISDVEKWMNAGVKTAKEYKAWNDIGAYPKAVIGWKNIGFKNPQDVKPWTDAGIPRDGANYITELKELNIKNPAEFKKWSQVGAIYPKIIKILQNNNLSPDDYQKYNLKGLDATKIVEFLNKGVKPSEVRRFIEVFYSVSELDKFMQMTNTTMDSVLPYFEFTSLEKSVHIKDWFKAGITEPASIKSWTANGYPYFYAQMISDLKFKNVDEANDFISTHLSNKRSPVKLLYTIYSALEKSQQNRESMIDWLGLLTKDRRFRNMTFDTIDVATKQAYLTPSDLKIMVDNKYAIDKRTLGNIRNWYGPRSKVAEYCKKRKVEFIGYVSKGANNMTAVRKMEKRSKKN
jgi:hypothetical protein